MLKKSVFIPVLIVAAGIFFFFNRAEHKIQRDCESKDEDSIVYTIVDPKHANIRFYWKDDSGRLINSFGRLKDILESKGETLDFAMNGGMFKPDYSPQGLYIQNNYLLSPADTSEGNGNFYLKPNGVFFIDRKKNARVMETKSFLREFHHYYDSVLYATQSGPMLVVNNMIHPVFTPGSKNVNIRNGVGVLPDGGIILAMSKTKISLYDFALFFKRLNCTNALYLDGYVSRLYFPDRNYRQMDGKFGVMIAISGR